MPELPEVEVTRRGVERAVLGRTVSHVLTRVPRLRWPVPAELPARLVGRPLQDVARRGKYLLLSFDTGWLLVHLGMSGSLVSLPAGAPLRTHEHVEIGFGDRVLRLHDPRRFGAVLWHDREDGPVAAHPLLARLGVEPLEPGFDGALLHAATRGRRVSVKQALLAGGIVVGVGNIYASESLFRAGIRPTRPAGALGRAAYERLAEAVRQTLSQAIERGGSSLRDFVGSDGTHGQFQAGADVYDRAGLPCRRCATPVRMIRQQGRSTFYCPACQPPR